MAQLFEYRLPLLLAGDVVGQIADFPAVGGKLRQRLLPATRGDIGDDHLRLLFQKALGDSQADARCAAGDQRGFILQSAHLSSLFFVAVALHERVFILPDSKGLPPAAPAQSCRLPLKGG